MVRPFYGILGLVLLFGSAHIAFKTPPSNEVLAQMLVALTGLVLVAVACCTDAKAKP